VPRLEYIWLSLSESSKIHLLKKYELRRVNASIPVEINNRVAQAENGGLVLTTTVLKVTLPSVTISDEDR
jgi:hypothetical protein